MFDKYKIYIGIWIDHKQAFIIYIQNNKSTLLKIESSASAHLKPAEVTGPEKEADGLLSESSNPDRNKYKNHLDSYYNKIISEIQNNDSILIFGPGEAKRELLKRIESSHLCKVKIAGIETVGKMTEKQIIAYTKDYYNVK